MIIDIVGEPVKTGDAPLHAEYPNLIVPVYSINGQTGKWSNPKFPVPSIGERVHCTLNNIGNAQVTGYFVDCGYLGIEVQPDILPECLIKKGKNRCLVFGGEVESAA